jgi:hypothetical protein
MAGLSCFTIVDIFTMRHNRRNSRTTGCAPYFVVSHAQCFKKDIHVSTSSLYGKAAHDFANMQAKNILLHSYRRLPILAKMRLNTGDLRFDKFKHHDRRTGRAIPQLCV